MAVEEVAGRTPAVPPAARTAAVERPRPKREREEEVLVWPDLVFIEFIAAVLFTLTFIVLSVFIDAPLLNRANPDVTPDRLLPDWYLLWAFGLLKIAPNVELFGVPVISGKLLGVLLIVITFLGVLSTRMSLPYIKAKGSTPN